MLTSKRLGSTPRGLTVNVIPGATCDSLRGRRFGWRVVEFVTYRWLGVVLAALVALSTVMVPPKDIRLAVADAPIFDDFNGPDGAPPDPALWGYDLFVGQNGELQTYTDAPENVRLDGQGNLVIDLLQTPFGYTSGRVVTRGKADFLYGTVSARIQMPAGRGLLPAFWLLGSDYDTVRWPMCGEIDIMELPNVGTAYHSTIIGPTDPYVPGTKWQTAASGPIAPPLSDGFHEYWVRRSENEIVFGIDDVQTAVFTPQTVPPGGQWVFNKPMYALLNIAVGNVWTGPPDDTTQFPATMLVDWFRYTP